MSAPAGRVLVIVPAWNEEESLPGVLTEIRAALPDVDILVVDDGSGDSTASVAEMAGVLVAHLPINLGVGAAMRTGYRYASRRGYAVTVQIDADGQHNPSDVPALLALIVDGANIAVGARVEGDGAFTARGPRRWAMRLLSAVISRIAGSRLTDTTSGFKACDTQAIELFARTYPAEYLGDTVESLVVAARAHLVIREVGVLMRHRAGGAPSHKPLRSAVFLLRAVLALALALTRPRPDRPAEHHYEELSA
ncbi:MAG: glycosyltransferase family 2 protein [Actinomycetota bacterium]|nr:glycosyltransferase family 2 protein [Actinomycetota bacterium]